jgi:hypothetical protein
VRVKDTRHASQRYRIRLRGSCAAAAARHPVAWIRCGRGGMPKPLPVCIYGSRFPMGERTRIDATNTSAFTRADSWTSSWWNGPTGRFAWELRWPASAFARTRQLAALIQSAACSAGTRSPVRQQAVGLVFWGKPRKRREQEVEQRLAQAVSLFAPSWAQTLLEGLGRKAIARRISIRAFRFRAFFRHDLARRRHHQVGSRRWSVFASLPSNTARFWSAARRL